MKKYTISATFMGADGSMGYRTDQDYTLEVQERPRQSEPPWRVYPLIEIIREDGTGTCAYESLLSFLRNWDNIILIEPDGQQDSLLGSALEGSQPGQQF